MKENKLFIILIIFLFICSVKGDISTGWTENTLETISNANIGGLASSGEAMFYNSLNDRWYMFYTYDSSTNRYIRYSYTDSGDVTTVTNGGVASHVLIGDANANDNIFSDYGNWFSVLYDEENLIGHLFYCVNNYGQPKYLYYRNFTVLGGGSLGFGTARELRTFSDASGKIFVSSCLDENNLPIFLTSEYTSSLSVWMWKPSKIDLYTATFTKVEINENTLNNRCSLGLIPYQDNDFLIISANAYADESLYYARFDFDTATNLSVTLATGFSDYTVNWEYDYDSTRPRSSYWGYSYNETDVGIVYAEGGSNYKKAWFFMYDFATDTKGSEYLCLQAVDYIYPDISIHDNEFFVFGYAENTTTNYDYILANEYTNQYSGPFNVTGQKVLFSVGLSHAYNPTFMCPTFCKSNGEILFVWDSGQVTPNKFVYSYGTIEGQYAPVTPRIIDPLVPYELIGLILFLVGSVMMVSGPCLLVIRRTPESFLYMFILCAVGLGLILGWIYW